MNEVQSPATPKAVREYQNMASEYDVTKSYQFDGRNSPFTLVFRTEKGTITANYDANGEVISSKEQFRNVAPPTDMVKKVLSEYDGWKLVKSNYYVSYNKNKSTVAYHTLQITNGKKKKSISMDVDGTL